ncbi:MAG: hypothetical protein JWN95_108 [Frankiales bacterium]|nr:hypothetical protein [Frankiales bacterium]
MTSSLHPPSDSTLADVRANPRRRWGRRLGLSVLLVIVLLGATGWLGVHANTRTADGDGYQLRVTYPQVARPGLDVPFRVTVRHAGGFTDDVSLAITSDYFRMFETQGFFPNASTDSNDGRYYYATFTKPPPGHDFQVDYDAYIQPSQQLGKGGSVELLVQGKAVAKVHIRTWLAP